MPETENQAASPTTSISAGNASQIVPDSNGVGANIQVPHLLSGGGQRRASASIPGSMSHPLRDQDPEASEKQEQQSVESSTLNIPIIRSTAVSRPPAPYYDDDLRHLYVRILPDPNVDHEENVLVDTGCCVTSAEKQWIVSKYPGLVIHQRPGPPFFFFDIAGVRCYCSEYVDLPFYLKGEQSATGEPALAAFTRPVDIITGFGIIGINMFLGLDVLEGEGFTLSPETGSAVVGSCGDLKVGLHRVV